MRTVTAAALTCRECDCTAMYSGPLDVASALCVSCKHPLVSHQIGAHGATAEDPLTGEMSDDFEIAPYFR